MYLITREGMRVVVCAEPKESREVLLKNLTFLLVSLVPTKGWVL